MTPLLYVSEQRALIIMLDRGCSSWTVIKEISATEDGAEQLSDWMQQQRVFSIEVLLDFSDLSVQRRDISKMPFLTKLRFHWALRQLNKDPNSWFNNSIKKNHNKNGSFSLTQFSMRENSEPSIWQPVLMQYVNRLKAVYPVIFLASSLLVSCNDATDKLLCVACSGRRCCHQYFRDNELCYIRVLPYPPNSLVLKQQIEQTLDYLKREYPDRSPEPSVLVAEEFDPEADDFSSDDNGGDISDFTVVGENYRTPVSTIKVPDNIVIRPSHRFLISQFTAGIPGKNTYRLSDKRGGFVFVRTFSGFVKQPRILLVVNFVLLAAILIGLNENRSQRLRMSGFAERTIQLNDARRQLPATTQTMRDAVLTQEALLLHTASHIELLNNLARTVSTMPDLMLGQVEWLTGESATVTQDTQLAMSLTADHRQSLDIDDAGQSHTVVRLNGKFQGLHHSYVETHNLYTEFRDKLLKLDGVRLLEEKVPYDSAAVNFSSSTASGGMLGDFSILLAVVELNA